jgi:type IV pilus assembly protein PilY1
MEKTTAGNYVYLALFKPTASAFWRGNIKKLGIADEDDTVLSIKRGDILDSNGNKATDGMGEILDTSVSYWNTTEDGGETDMGGVGEILLNRSTERQIYSILCGDHTHHQPFTHGHNAFAKTNDSRIPPALFGVSNDTERDKIIDFVHGFDAYDQDGDLNTTEKREWILGAFLHSRPTVIHYDATTSVIFAGANDGMLHAFLDSDGSELWAFIPPEFLGRLKDLTRIDTNRPEYFVDGAPSTVIIDANGDGDISEQDGDKAILIFGERRGGGTYWGIDVTDPTDPLAPSALWKIDNTDPDFLELGQTWSTPTIAHLANGLTVAIFGAGYDLNRDTDTAPDVVGRGVYIVDVLTGDLVWKYTFDDDPLMDSSIPSDITTVDANDNGYVDRLYVGSLSGKIWRFDVPGTDSTQWTAKIIYNGERKIFYQPDVLFEDGYEILVWGTGDRANPKRKDFVNRIYMLKDRDVSGLTESDLVDVTDSEDTLTTANGWYIRLNTNLGEKVLAAPVTFFGASYLTTFTPGEGDETDPCYLSEGTATLYGLDYKNGNPLIDLDGDPETDPVRSISIGSSIPSGIVITLIKGWGIGLVGVSGGIYNQDLAHRHGITRIYWRELF